MIKLKNAALIAALVVFTASNIYSQSGTESVILYNKQPIKVELTEMGSILSFIGLVPGYMDGYDISTDPSETLIAAAEEKPSTESFTKNADYDIISIERVQLKYKSNFATLDKSTIDKLNKIAAKLKADPSSKILLTAHTYDKQKNKLSSNRLDSAIAYLGIKGILSYRIQTDIQQSESLIDVIAINYLN